MGKVDGEVGEDLVHLLGGLAPGCPEVHRGGPRAAHRRVQLRLRPNLPHRAARHRHVSASVTLSKQPTARRRDSRREAATRGDARGLRLGVFFSPAVRCDSDGRFQKGPARGLQLIWACWEWVKSPRGKEFGPTSCHSSGPAKSRVAAAVVGSSRRPGDPPCSRPTSL